MSNIQVIEIPGYGELEFPADMSDADIQKAIGSLTYEDLGIGAEPAAPVAPTAPAETYDPMEGMSAADKFFAGMGKSVYDTGRGLKLLGLRAADTVTGGNRTEDYQAQLAELEAADKALTNSGWGMAGNIAGSVGQLVGPGAALGAAGKVAAKAGAQGAGRALLNTGRALAAPNTYKGAAASGAALAGVQPADHLGENLGQALFGGAAGVAGLAIPRIAVGVTQGIGSVFDPLTAAGRERVVARAMNRFATDPSRLARATGEIVPGSAPTLSEATLDPGLAILEKAAANADPQIAAALTERYMANNAARLQQLNTGVLDDPAYELAKMARDQAAKKSIAAVKSADASVDTRRVVNALDRAIVGNAKRPELVAPLDQARQLLFDPFPVTQRASKAWDDVRQVLATKTLPVADARALETARKVLAGVKSGKLEPDAALAQLKGLTAKDKTAQASLTYANDLLKAPDMVLTEDPRALFSASKAIGDMLEKRGPAGTKVNEAAMRELVLLKKSLDRSIAKSVPEYGQYLRDYQKASRPLNQSDLMAGIRDKVAPAVTGVDALGNRTGAPGRMSVAADDLDAIAKKATGFKRAKAAKILSDQQKRALELVEKDLSRAGAAAKLPRVGGSDTARNLISQNILERTLGPLGIPVPQGGIRGGAVEVSRSLANGIDIAYKLAGSNERVAALLSGAVLDAGEAARIMKSLTPAQRGAVMKALSATGRGLERASPTLGLGSYVASE